MTKHLLTVFLCLLFSATIAQDRMLSGTLTDKGEPILFGTVAVYRNGVLLTGVETDLDGKYSIPCQVGDRIEFSYIGYTPRSIYVTEQMLNGSDPFQKIFIAPKKSEAFKQKMEKRKRLFENAYALDSSNMGAVAKLPYKNILDLKISDFQIKDGQLSVDRPGKYIHYKASFSQKVGVQFVAPWHKHQLQSTFAQGRPIQGLSTFREFNKGESFSFGPTITSLHDQGIRSRTHDLMTSGITHTTKAAIKTEQNNKKLYGSLFHQRSPDIFNRFDQSRTKFKVGWTKYSHHKWSTNNFINVEFQLEKATLENQNYTGNYHSILQSMMLQSPSYDPEKYTAYSPSFQNPVQTLNNSSSPISYQVASLLLNQKWKSDDRNTKIKNIVRMDIRNTNLSDRRSQLIDGIPTTSEQFYKVQLPTLQLASFLEHKFGDQLFTVGITNISKMARANFSERIESQPSINQVQDMFRHIVEPKIAFEEEGFKLSLSNAFLFSNNQPSSVLNPNYKTSYTYEFLDAKIDEISVYTSAIISVKEQDLLLDNYNYTSLLINHYDLQNQQLNVPLWIPNSLENESKEATNIGVILTKDYSRVTFSTHLKYSYINQKNVIFPVLVNDQFTLQNTSDFHTHKISWINRWKGWKEIMDTDMKYDNYIEISHFNTKATALHIPNERLPIAGFSNISKNIIEDQPVGVIVGSDFNRNAEGDVIIAADGFPTRSDEPSIIADPTPLFTFKNELNLSHNNWNITIRVDGQIGGKVWNGTQQTLDYYGVSQHSADLREKTNFVFDGVKADGSENDIEISLADIENGLDQFFWTRYGEEGIAANYVQDGSHISLKHIGLTKLFRGSNYRRNLELGIYMNNLLTIGSFRGFTTSQLYEDNIAYGLQYFNLPITTEIGTSLTLIF
ncbi:MAG: hypothetical protein P1U56_13160 [Saprospiraceae bacterium]|nr:hypothetical protein [Saprospiraceae bacterium]